MFLAHLTVLHPCLFLVDWKEIEELILHISSASSESDFMFGLPDLSPALKQIQSQYDSIAAKNLEVSGIDKAEVCPNSGVLSLDLFASYSVLSRKWRPGIEPSFRTLITPPVNIFKESEVWERKLQPIGRMWVLLSVLLVVHSATFLDTQCTCAQLDPRQRTWTGGTEDKEWVFGGPDPWQIGEI